MPIKDERAVRSSARKAGLKEGGERWKAYVYGTLSLIKKRRAEKHS